MENPKFLDKKYPDLAGSKPVERAVKKAKNDPERKATPHSRDERIQAYIDRIDKLLVAGTHVSDEKGWELLKNKIIKEFVIDTEDEDTLTKIAHGLYESEKRLAIERGQGAQVTDEENVIEQYKGLAKEKRDIQERSLGSWLSYLKQNDAEYPTWFRYFIVRNLQKMGTLDKEKGEYTKRTDFTIAPFPELNSEALGFVYRMLTTGVGHNEFVFNPDLDEPEKEKEIKEKREELTKLINKKDFIKLYTFAQIETAGTLNRESLKGEWKKYEQGSDYHILEDALRGKGTGWCTAEGSAYSHIQGGDFYVYYTLGTGGKYTEPRIAIRMEGEQVAEVRGVNHRQGLEPALVDTAKQQYQNLPGGDKFDKKSSDMNKVTELCKKQETRGVFTKDDLIFLYEIHTTIEGFGYDADKRIAELRSQRNLREDAPLVLECEPSQVAYNINDVNGDTKAYIGKWNLEIYQKLHENVKYIYEKFPDKKVFLRDLELDPKIGDAEIAGETLIEKGYLMSTWASDILNKTPFSKEKKTFKLVSFSVADFGFPNGATTTQIIQKAKELKMLVPAEIGPQMRLQYEDQPLDEYLYLAMEPITDSDGYPYVFNVRRNADGSWLGAALPARAAGGVPTVGSFSCLARLPTLERSDSGQASSTQD